MQKAVLLGETRSAVQICPRFSELLAKIVRRVVYAELFCAP